MHAHSLKIGLSFGLTSGVITTLGLIVGLNSGTHSKIIVIGGILLIAIADSLSDAFGIHLSEESEGKHSPKEIWISTLATFAFKLITALTFIIPVLIFNLPTAIIVSVAWGILILGILSYTLAKKQNKSPLKLIAEHVLIAGLVILIAHLVGDWIKTSFGS